MSRLVPAWVSGLLEYRLARFGLPCVVVSTLAGLLFGGAAQLNGHSHGAAVGLLIGAGVGLILGVIVTGVSMIED